MSPTTFFDDLLDVAQAAGAVANYCDHAEHNEVVDASWVLDSGQTLRDVARRVAEREGLDLRELYARRLEEIEKRGVRGVAEPFDGGAAARQANSWAELQRVQVEHDRAYHPDVVGLHKAEQLRHYALHLAKLSAALSEVIRHPERRDDFLRHRLPDLLLFGMKLPTVMGRPLADSALPTASLAAVA
jgi:hypothetical protein